MMQAFSAIKVRELAVSFGALPLFEAVSFAISEGEHVALTGPSGCGKSTVLRCLLGFVAPVAGEVLVQGQPLNAATVWALRGVLAYVPQEPDLGIGTVRGFMERPFHYKINHGCDQAMERLPELMQAVDLEMGLLDSDVDTLSGGEKQRVALVSALLLERPILLLDEVASALDRDSRDRVWALLAQQTHKTILGVVHEGAGMPFATREVVICSGGA